MRVVRAATAVVGLGAVIAGVTACGNSAGSGAAGGRPKVAFVVANSTLNFAREMIMGFEAGVARAGGVDCVTDGPPSVDGPRQVQIFQDLAGTSTAGMSVFTLSPDLFVPALKAAAADGIPLIAVDSPPAPGTGVELFVGNDNYELGRLLAGEVVGRLLRDATGTVVLGTTAPGVPLLDHRAQGMRDELRARLPRVQVLGPFDTKQDVPANLAAWSGLVRANPHALAFLGTGDADGWNLASIRQRTHGRWLAGAYDVDPRSLRAARDRQLLLVSPEHYLKGAIAGQLQAQRARDDGKLAKGWIYTPGLVITPANVAAIIKRETSPATRQAWFAGQLGTILGDLDSYLRPMADVR